MTRYLSRRLLLLGTLGFASNAAAGTPHPFYGGDMFVRDPALIPPPESPVDFEIASVNLKSIPSQYRRQIVEFDGFEPPGTVIVNPHQRMLYLTLGDGKALRFGVGVGRDGFAWSGEALINMKRVWPRWVPPEEMVLRDKTAAKWANGMPGGPENPLGARALYLFANGEDTLYRIHGTNEPKSIGEAVSSGCIRLLNQDIAELYSRVPLGSKVIVLSGEDAIALRQRDLN